MANLKVFVSSTCYDLSIVRSQLRNFIINFGYEPVMSDFSDVLYDPRIHTHTSCVQEIENCDMLILIIGSRLGGKAIPKALELVDFDLIKGLSSCTNIFDNANDISITQLEVLKAIESGIPIFTFIDSKVISDHLVYEKNKDKDFLDKIDFPSFSERPEVAKYVFEFINFLRHRIENNNITGFSKMEDIEVYLRKQWSGLLQRLLYEQRFRKVEERKMDYLTNQIADIKTAIMTSITSSDLRETAKGAIKYRLFIQFVFELKSGNQREIMHSNLAWEEFLRAFKITKIIPQKTDKSYGSGTILILEDGTYYSSMYSERVFDKFKKYWEEFVLLGEEAKQAIINAIVDDGELRMPPRLRYVDKIYKEEFENQDIENENDKIDINEKDLPLQ